MKDVKRGVYLFGPYKLEVEERRVSRDGRPIRLAPKEFETLLALVEAGGRLVEKGTLAQRVWPKTFVGDSSLARNISVLRKALGEDMIQTVPRLGYRLGVDAAVPQMDARTGLPQPLSSSPSPLSSQSGDVATPQLAVPERSLMNGSPRRGTQSFVALGLVLLVSGAAILLIHSSIKNGASAKENSNVRIAVLPFVNLTGQDDEEYLCDGLTEGTISELGRVAPERLVVIARTSAMKYKNSTKGTSEIAQELRVDYLLEGTVRNSGDRLRITTQLIRGSDASHVWTGEYERDLKNVVTVQRDLTAAVVAEVGAKLSPEASAKLKSSKGRIDPEAYRYYQLGRYYWNKRDRKSVEQSMRYFERAMQLEPSYSAPYAGAADAYILLAAGYILPPRDAYVRSRKAAEKALQLDDTTVEAYTSLAYLKFVDSMDWAGAEKDYRRAIALDPNYVTAHHWYALYLAAMRRTGESIQEITRALELDPLSVAVNQNAGFIYIQARRYDEALIWLNKALEIDPNSATAHCYLAMAYEWKSQYDKAVAEFKAAQKLTGRRSPYEGGIGHVYAISGRRVEAQNILQQLVLDEKREVVAAYGFALIYAGLGDKERAFHWLRRAIDDRSCTVTEVNTDPALDVLRTDPRFKQILREFNLN